MQHAQRPATTHVMQPDERQLYRMLGAMVQFLGEAVMLSLVGGALGVLFGIFGSYLVGQTLHWQTQMSLESVVVAAFFAIAVGVFFGYYPARKASLLDPIEALRYE